MDNQKRLQNVHWRNRIIIFSIIVFFLSFVFYLLTLSPSLSAESDSGELVTSCAFLGISHPPGYPVFTMLGYLFSNIPFGDIAYRLNMMSAFFSSLSSVILFLICIRLSINCYASLGVSLLFSFSRDIWRFSLSCEVFSLAVFFIASLIYVFLLWRDDVSSGRDSSTKSVYIFFTLLGLSLAHHHAVILILPAFIYLFIIDGMYKSLKSPGTLVCCLIFFLIGLIPYAYLPIRSIGKPLICWGEPDTLNGFIRIVTRAGYGSLSLASVSGSSWSSSVFFNEVFKYFKTLYVQFTPVFFVLGFFGIIVSWIRNRVICIFFFMLILSYSILFIWLAKMPEDEGSFAIVSRFFLPSYIFFSIFSGFFFDYLITLKKGFAKLLFISLSVVLPLVLIPVNYHIVDRHDNYIAPDYGRNLLLCLPENTLIFIAGDVPSCALLYCQKVEGRRKDVFVVFEGLIRSKWYIRQLISNDQQLAFLGSETGKSDKKALIMKIIEKTVGQRPVYFNHPVSDQDIKLVCEGLAYRLINDDKARSDANNGRLQSILDDDYKYRGKYTYAKQTDYFSFELLRMYSIAYYYLGCDLLASGESKKATTALKKSLSFFPESAESLIKLGQAETECGLFEDALESFMNAKKISGETYDICMALAVLYARKGNVEQAKDALKRASMLRK